MSADESDVAIEDYCGFDENWVYLFMAIARTKENPSLSSGSDVVFREVITDTEDIRRKYQKLQAIATGYRDASGERLTFQLYLTVNYPTLLAHGLRRSLREGGVVHISPSQNVISSVGNVLRRRSRRSSAPGGRVPGRSGC